MIDTWRFIGIFRDSDQIIADCFNDVRRSILIRKLGALQHHGILTQEHLKKLSSETQQELRSLTESTVGGTVNEVT